MTTVGLSAEQQTDRWYAGSAEDRARMHLLRHCCGLYQGNHPFHNYTKRRLYRTPEAVSTAGTFLFILFFYLTMGSQVAQAAAVCLFHDVCV